MKRSRCTKDQIIGILKEHETGISVADLCRKHGVSDATVCKWKAKYGGMDVSEAKRIKGLEDENAWLKRLLARRSHHDLWARWPMVTRAGSVSQRVKSGMLGTNPAWATTARAKMITGSRGASIWRLGMDSTHSRQAVLPKPPLARER